MQQPLHEAYTDNEKKTLRFLKEYKIANKEIEAELSEVYRKMNVENPLISDFYRFGHLQKLQDKIQKTIQQLGNLEEDYLKGRMKQGLVLGIETVINKIPETELNKRAIDQMITRPWQGGNFSDRVWRNKRLLANQLNDKLRNGIIQGKSPFQIANDLSERMQVGRYQAQRLVRTEYMHVLNQGQIEGYKAKGYTKLKWHASKDERTCEICGEHHGNEYDIDEAPHLPAHPGCRCTFVPVIDVDSAAEELKQARAELNSISRRSIIELEKGTDILLYRKKENVFGFEPMPKKQFLRKIKEFKKIGGLIQCDEYTENYLLNVKKAEGVTYNGYTILLPRRPSRSAVYEELFHAQQYRDGKIDGSELSRVRCEIEAQMYLLDNVEKFNFTEKEVELTKKNLNMYKNDLERLLGGDKDEI